MEIVVIDDWSKMTDSELRVYLKANQRPSSAKILEEQNNLSFNIFLSHQRSTIFIN